MTKFGNENGNHHYDSYIWFMRLDYDPQNRLHLHGILGDELLIGKNCSFQNLEQVESFLVKNWTHGKCEIRRLEEKNDWMDYVRKPNNDQTTFYSSSLEQLPGIQFFGYSPNHVVPDDREAGVGQPQLTRPMNSKYVTNRAGKIIGRYEGDTLRDETGRIVARYDKANDKTVDRSGRIIGRGDQRIRTLNQDE